MIPLRSAHHRSDHGLAPIEEFSDAESTGGSIPFDNKRGNKDAPGEEVNGETEGDEGDEDE